MGNMGKMVVFQGLERSFPAQHPRVSRPTAALGAGAGRCGAAPRRGRRRGSLPFGAKRGKAPQIDGDDGGKVYGIVATL